MQTFELISLLMCISLKYLNMHSLNIDAIFVV